MSVPPIPPSDQRDRTALQNPDWRSIAISYALIASVPLALWGIANPLAAALLVAAGGALVGAASRGRHLARCLSTCRELSFDVGRRFRVVLAMPGRHPPADGDGPSRRATGPCERDPACCS